MHGWNRPAGKQNDLLAFKMQWRLSSAQHADLERHVELILFPGGYAGLQPIEAGGANLCLLVRRGAYRAMGGNWLALLEHLRSHSRHLSDRLTGAAPLWAKPLSLSSIPYGYVRADAEADLWRLGDQSAVIPSFAGDGMSIALHSAALAAEIYKQGGNAREFQRRLHGEISRQVGLATWISRMLVHAPGSTMWLAGMWPGILAAVGDTTRIASRHLLR
jgi:flavin-dependent dehydrogenase